MAFPHWEWADYDRQRIVWASDGKLMAAFLTNRGLIDEKELFDFNEMAFRAIVAPY
jgi:hypothetical protein